MSLTNAAHIKDAQQYQKLTDISHEIHSRIIKIFTPAYRHTNEYDNMVYNYPALKDSLESLLFEDYRTVVYDSTIEMNERQQVEVTLHFIYDKCERSFTLFHFNFETDND